FSAGQPPSATRVWIFSAPCLPPFAASPPSFHRRGELAVAAPPLWAVATRYRGEMDHVGLKDRSTDDRKQAAAPHAQPGSTRICRRSSSGWCAPKSNASRPLAPATNASSLVPLVTCALGPRSCAGGVSPRTRRPR